MRFVSGSSVKVLFCVFFGLIATRAVQAYDASVLMFRLKEKTANIQLEYQKLRSEKKLRYFWDKKCPRCWSFSIFGGNIKLSDGKTEIMSTKDISYQTKLIFPSESEQNLKKRSDKFSAVVMSENFLRTLLGNIAIREFICCPSWLNHAVIGLPLQTAYVWLQVDKNPSENPSNILNLSLRLKQVYYEEISFFTEKIGTVFDLTLGFTCDVEKDVIKFIGLKGTPIIDGRFVKDTCGIPVLNPSH